MTNFISGKELKTFKTKKGNKVVIRYPKWEDLDKLLLFINSLIEENTFIMISGNKKTKDEEIEYLVDTIKQIEQNKKVQLFVFVKDKLVGNSAITQQSYREKHVGQVDISVSKGYRNEGIGKELLNSLIHEAKYKLKVKLLTLTVFENNKRGIAFYKKLGFKEAGTVPKSVLYKGKYVGLMTMYLELE
jgi:RimJ/RimL family protein N-acetyltransferase